MHVAYPMDRGVVPNQYCEPHMTTVGSQDTTGPMTLDELRGFACLGLSADLVMQSFCHTVTYPKPVDVVTHHTLPDFIRTRGGVTLRPWDGIIHLWLNRMLLPDTVGTGGDSIMPPRHAIKCFSQIEWHHAARHYPIQQVLLTVEKKCKKNVFSGW
jgi:aconitate hydratase 2 / 2-methylisocitrate dehydratase